jgi:transaldolase
MTTHLESLKKHSLVVADTGDIDAVARWKPQDATTNPSLLLTSAEDPRYQPLVESAIRDANGDVAVRRSTRSSCSSGCASSSTSPGGSRPRSTRGFRSTPRSRSTRRSRLIALYEKEGVSRSRVLIKLASTWEGIRAAEKLGKEKIHCNMTLLFSFAQAARRARRPASRSSHRSSGGIYDWHKQARKGRRHPARGGSRRRLGDAHLQLLQEARLPDAGDGRELQEGGQIELLAGCDLLTIAPDLLDKLSKAEARSRGAFLRKTAKAQTIPQIDIDEKSFRWMHNEDAMATDKLAEGIRRFDADARKLEKLITSLAAAVPAK